MWYIWAVLNSPAGSIRRLLEAVDEELRGFVARWQVSELSVFGSAARDELAPGSDIDFLVEFAPQARRTLLEHVAMQQELEMLLGRRVDLVSRRAVERSANPIRRDEILKTAQVIHVARPGNPAGH